EFEHCSCECEPVWEWWESAVAHPACDGGGCGDGSHDGEECGDLTVNSGRAGCVAGCLVVRGDRSCGVRCGCDGAGESVHCVHLPGDRGCAPCGPVDRVACGDCAGDGTDGADHTGQSAWCGHVAADGAG